MHHANYDNIRMTCTKLVLTGQDMMSTKQTLVRDAICTKLNLEARDVTVRNRIVTVFIVKFRDDSISTAIVLNMLKELD